MRLIEVVQGTREWFNARSGVPTGSRASDIVDADGNLKQPRAIAAREAGKLADSVETYLCELLAEPYTERMDEQFPVTSAMQYGIDTEVRARTRYELMTNPVSLRMVGFCMHDSGLFGCSPDGLIYDDIGTQANLLGGLELKCLSSGKHARYLREGILPEEFKAQVHCGLIVTGAQWWDFMAYHERMEPLLVRVYPNDYTIRLEASLRKFAEILAAEKAKFTPLADGNI